jgi:hypothetical protein
MQEVAASQGLVAGNIPGYKAINDDVEVYHYPQSLPGNLSLWLICLKRFANSRRSL